MGAETLGCHSRPDGGGDGVTGATQESQLALAFSDTSRFGCVLGHLSAGMVAGGYFNVSLTAINDAEHRGDAYLGFLGTRMIDVATGAIATHTRRTVRHARCTRASRRSERTGDAITPTGDPFDAEVPPRILSISPAAGSLAGGTELTVRGTGFGTDTSAIEIDVGGVPCDVSRIRIRGDGVHCRLRWRPTATTPSGPTPTAALASYVGERGTRWQWAQAGGRSILLPSFATPSDCASGCGAGWAELAPSGSVQTVEVRRYMRSPGCPATAPHPLLMALLLHRMR